MQHPLIDVSRIELPPGVYLASIGDVFATFDERTQDSGNISYGVTIEGARYFVKTAGAPDDVRWHLDHGARVELLRNAVVLGRGCRHSALVPLLGVIESPQGPALVYDWVDGELLGVPVEQRDDARSALQRFRALPATEVLAALDAVFGAHGALTADGWVANDFCDGSMIYDFERHQIHLIDLDSYRPGVFVNRMGRMFGSTRFMAPEEFEPRAPIDQRTTVFTLGRTAAVLLSDGTLERGPFRGGDAQHAVLCRACEPQPDARHPSVTAFVEAWRAAS